jgi:hypothetical protein
MRFDFRFDYIHLKNIYKIAMCAISCSPWDPGEIPRRSTAHLMVVCRFEGTFHWLNRTERT